MTVAEVQKLRKNLLHKGGQLKVAKNTLLKRATHDMAGLSELAPYFKDNSNCFCGGPKQRILQSLLPKLQKRMSS